MCHWPLLIRSSNFKLQAPTTRAQGNNVFWRTTRSLFPSRWASWGDMRPSSREYSAAHVRFNERKDSSKFFKASNCAHTPYQDTQTCVELPMLDSTNVRIQESSMISHESWMNRLMHFVVRRQKSKRVRVWETRMPLARFSVLNVQDHNNIKINMCKVKIRLKKKIYIYTKIDKFLVVVPKLWLQYMTWELLLYSLKQRNKDIDETGNQNQKPSSTLFFSRKRGGVCVCQTLAMRESWFYMPRSFCLMRFSFWTIVDNLCWKQKIRRRIRTRR